MRPRTSRRCLPQAMHLSVAAVGVPFVLSLALLSATALLPATGFAVTAPVPGYVPPVTQEQAPDYVDDTRGVFVPTHPQQRLKTDGELATWQAASQTPQPYYAQQHPNGQAYQQQLNTVANGVGDTGSELDRIAQDPGLLSGGKASSDAQLYAGDTGVHTPLPNQRLAQNVTTTRTTTTATSLDQFPSLANGGQARISSGGDIGNGASISAPIGTASGDGQEIAGGLSTGNGQSVDMQNGVVRLKEERIAVRRAIQRMMDQIGAGNWTVVWDLDEQNAGLPDMEISIYAEEPFIKVLNALLGRLQSRSGQPLRVVRYDKTQRLVITDRSGNLNQTEHGVGAGSTGGKTGDAVVTESVLKESNVSLHYDEVPLTDALENIVNQAGKGQWRLRMYAGSDQVLKPAHIEEPFGVALERILKVFNLRYEVFPGGKLIVVTSGDRFGFRGVQ